MSLQNALSSMLHMVSFDSLRLQSLSLDQTSKKKQPENSSIVFLMGQVILWHPTAASTALSNGGVAQKSCGGLHHLCDDSGSTVGGRHLTAERLEPYRLIGDGPMDELLEFIATEDHPLRPDDDLFSQKSSGRFSSATREKIRTFREYYSNLPPWVDLEQLERGQHVFIRYSAAISMSLYYRSLVPGFSVPKVAKVIQSTGYLSPPSTPHDVTTRLMDTGGFLTACLLSLKHLLPGEEGWTTALQVRLLHAKVRRALLRRKGKREWNIDKYGIPINQEDMAATVLAFSVNTLAGLEFVQGFDLSRREKEDYVALWRYIGWLLGVYTNVDEKHDQWLTPCSMATSSDESPKRYEALRALDPCGPGWISSFPSSIDHANCMFQSMLIHLLEPDESSVIVSNHLLKIGRVKDQKMDMKQMNDEDEFSKKKWKKSQKEHDSFMYHSRGLFCRQFIGDPLANHLKLPIHPSFWIRLILSARVRIVLWMARVYTWLAHVPIVRKKLFQFHLKSFHGFHSNWKEKHRSQMGSKMEAAKEDRNGNTLEPAPGCPFAMIHPPEF